MGQDMKGNGKTAKGMDEVLRICQMGAGTRGSSEMAKDMDKIFASIDNSNTENFKLGDLFKLTMINVFMIFVYSLPLLILFFVLWSL